MVNRGGGEIVLLACTLGSAGIAGCGGGSMTGGDAGVQSDGGVTPEASLAEVGTDAGADVAPAPPCSAEEAGDAQVAARDIGTVIVEDGTNASGASGTLTASFQAAGTVIAPPECTVTTVGACQVSVLCDGSLPDPSCVSPNAGVISLEDDGDAGSSTNMIQPEVPYTLPGPGGGWYPGESTWERYFQSAAIRAGASPTSFEKGVLALHSWPASDNQPNSRSGDAVQGRGALSVANLPWTAPRTARQ